MNLQFYVDNYSEYRKMSTITLLQPDINSKDTGYKKKKELTIAANSYHYSLQDYKGNMSENALNTLSKKYWLANKDEYTSFQCIYYSVKVMSLYNNSSANILNVRLYTAGMDVDDVGTVNSDDGMSYSLRPVVELKANIFGTKAGDTWNLNN